MNAGFVVNRRFHIAVENAPVSDTSRAVQPADEWSFSFGKKDKKKGEKVNFALYIARFISDLSIGYGSSSSYDYRCNATSIFHDISLDGRGFETWGTTWDSNNIRTATTTDKKDDKTVKAGKGKNAADEKAVEETKEPPTGTRKG
jgi:hypothetical protein